jgi:hypothetical protein
MKVRTVSRDSISSRRLFYALLALTLRPHLALRLCAIGKEAKRHPRPQPKTCLRAPHPQRDVPSRNALL